MKATENWAELEVILELGVMMEMVVALAEVGAAEVA